VSALPVDSHRLPSPQAVGRARDFWRRVDRSDRALRPRRDALVDAVRTSTGTGAFKSNVRRMARLWPRSPFALDFDAGGDLRHLRKSDWHLRETSLRGNYGRLQAWVVDTFMVELTHDFVEVRGRVIEGGLDLPLGTVGGHALSRFYERAADIDDAAVTAAIGAFWAAASDCILAAGPGEIPRNDFRVETVDGVWVCEAVDNRDRLVVYARTFLG
jgi:hypothetical protein